MLNINVEPVAAHGWRQLFSPAAVPQARGDGRQRAQSRVTHWWRVERLRDPKKAPARSQTDLLSGLSVACEKFRPPPCRPDFSNTRVLASGLTKVPPPSHSGHRRFTLYTLLIIFCRSFSPSGARQTVFSRWRPLLAPSSPSPPSWPP